MAPQPLARRKCPDPGSRVHALAAPVGTFLGGFGLVESDPYCRREALLTAMIRQGLLDSHRACDRGLRVVEGDEEPIARRPNDLTLVAGNH